jgi:ATP-binding cassette subfamily B protein
MAVSVNVLLGLAPLVFMTAIGLLVGDVPVVIHGHARISQMLPVPGICAFVAFTLTQILPPVQLAIAELVTRRIDGRVFARLMESSLRGSSIGPLEDPKVLNHLGEATRDLELGHHSPGKACAGQIALIARYTQLAGCVVLIGLAFSWIWGAAGIALVVLQFRYGQRGGLRRYSVLFKEIAPARRRSRYLRDLAGTSLAAKDIKVYGLSEWLKGQYRTAYEAWLIRVWRRRREIYLWPYIGYSVVGFAISATVLVVLGHGAYRISFTALIIGLQACLAAFRLGDAYPEADVPTQYGMNGLEAIERFEQAMEDYHKPEEFTVCCAASITGLLHLPGASIHFEDITFRYPNMGRPVIEHLNMTLQAHKTTALVGVNGAGKSTIIKLLARLYDPSSGRITVGGENLASLQVDAWRQSVAIVFQDFLHYDTSIADNVAFGCVRETNDREGITDVIHAVGLAKTVDSLPLGIDTPIGRHLRGGTELSGGQWQRLAIARALFALRHGASILVLDEPTASLDPRAEAKFYDEFMQLAAGTTTLLVSHRFSTVRYADKILVLDGGQIAEQGSHQDLMDTDGQYARLFRMQASAFTEPNGLRAGSDLRGVDSQPGTATA